MGGAIDPRLLRRARATRWYLVAGTAVGTLTAALIVAQAWLVASAIGSVFDERRADAVWAALPLLVVVVSGRAGLSWLHTVVATRTSAAVKAQLRRDLLASRLRSPFRGEGEPAVPTAPGSGSMVVLMTQGLDALDGYFARYLPQLVLAVTVPLVVGVAVLRSDLFSAVAIAATLPLTVIFMVLVGLVTKGRMARRWRVQARLAHHFADLIGGLPTLQAFGRARAQVRGLELTEGANRRETLSLLRVSFLSALVLELVATLSVALVAVGVGLRVVQGELTLAVALFVLILAPEVYLPLRQVGLHYHDSVDGMAAAEQAFALIEEEEAGDATPQTVRRVVPDLRLSPVVFDDVGVRYGADRPGVSRLWAVRHVSLTVAPGEVVALAGPSGSGKSSLLATLLGLCPVGEGRIRVRGIDLAELDAEEWRRRLAWVPQQPGMISGTVADNVLLGESGAGPDEVRAALAAAGAGHLDPRRAVNGTADGLSAGELRRVALARALLRIAHGEAQLLVLDEPTAGLDAEVELVVLANLRRAGVAALVVSHRPAVLAAADRVLTLGDAADVEGPVALGSAA